MSLGKVLGKMFQCYIQVGRQEENMLIYNSSV